MFDTAFWKYSEGPSHSEMDRSRKMDSPIEWWVGLSSRWGRLSELHVETKTKPRIFRADENNVNLLRLTCGFKSVCCGPTQAPPDHGDKITR